MYERQVMVRESMISAAIDLLLRLAARAGWETRPVNENRGAPTHALSPPSLFPSFLYYFRSFYSWFALISRPTVFLMLSFSLPALTAGTSGQIANRARDRRASLAQ